MPAIKTDPILSPNKGDSAGLPKLQANSTQAQIDAHVQAIGKAQAARVFADLKGRITADPNLKIGLLYAANDVQAKQIHSAINSGAKIPGISGGGQAVFYGELIKLINADTSLPKDRIRVLPIATSMYGGDNTRPGNSVTKSELDRDLKQVQDHINQGYQVLGIPAPVDPQFPDKKYAIGGGHSAGFYLDKSIGGKSQGSYVQDCLKKMESGIQLKFSPAATGPATSPATGPVTYDAALNPDLNKLVAAYRSVTGKEPGIDRNGITLTFPDMKGAMDFLKDQAGKGVAFDMTCVGVDHRMYSDGNGKMVQGTKKEVEDYISNASQFKVGPDGALSRNSATGAAPNTVAPAAATSSSESLEPLSSASGGPEIVAPPSGEHGSVAPDAGDTQDAPANVTP